MSKRFPYNTEDLKPSRRDFLKWGGAGMATAMMARYGLAPILAQNMGEIPAELHPGSPNNARGWTTTLAADPGGHAGRSAGDDHGEQARSLGIRRWRRYRELALHALERRGHRHPSGSWLQLDGQRRLRSCRSTIWPSPATNCRLHGDGAAANLFGACWRTTWWKTSPMSMKTPSRIRSG